MSSLPRLIWIKFDNGERFPMLVSRTDGIPLFKPTVYSISMRRATGVASATLERDLRAILHLYAWAMNNGIDIDKRFADGEFLNIQEIDSLTQAAWQYYEQLSESTGTQRESKQISANNKIIKLEKFRKRENKANLNMVDAQTMGVRLRYIRDYLDWLALRKLSNVSYKFAGYGTLDAIRQQMKQAIEARIPMGKGRSSIDQREGMEAETEARLREVIALDSEENPWLHMDTRIRNQLIILIMLELGIRRGEVLGIRIEDIDFRENKLLIRRAADDPKDPRVYQPNAKTIDRRLPLSEALSKLIYEYILNIRGKKSAAKKHGFLFVATDSGIPLSLNSMTKLFRTLRNRVSGLPYDLTSHVMRHTWNDRFSEVMDKKKVKEAEEHQMRSYLMGWSPTSGTSATYTRRHTRKKAMEVSLQLQRALTKQNKDKDDAGK